MQRYLITGVSGFVAYHFLELLRDKDESCTVLGLDVSPPSWDAAQFPFPIETSSIDLLDYTALEALIVRFRPSRILHLASISNVGMSWRDPVKSFQNNINIFLNLLECVRTNGLECRVLSVGSSEEYGMIEKTDLPLVETAPLKPGSPYGVARVAQEQLSLVFAQGFNMDLVMTRSFNHIGPGQRDQFVIPSFVKQVMAAHQQKRSSLVMRTGNVEVIRDFLDVRDVVVAYHGLFEHGQPGQVYNVCSGAGHRLDEVLTYLAKALGMAITWEQDPELIRPNELMEIVGSNTKIRRDIGWTPTISFERSLDDLMEYWKHKV